MRLRIIIEEYFAIAAFSTLLSLSCFASLGQTNITRELLRKACYETGPFIGQSPIRLKLLMDDTATYWHTFNDFSGKNLDKASLIQLIANVQNADSSLWADNNLKGKILVPNTKVGKRIGISDLIKGINNADQRTQNM